MAYIDIVEYLRRHETVPREQAHWPGRPIGSSARSLYPNLAAEYMCSGYHLWVLADHANVSKEIIAAVIEDDEELELHELYSLSRLFECSMEYLLSPRLSVLDPNTHRDVFARYKLMQLVERAGEIPDKDFRKPFISPVVALLKQGEPIYRAAYNHAISNLWSIIGEQEQKQRKRTRTAIDRAS